VTEEEYQEIEEAHNAFRVIRYGLHALAKRKEDRLLSCHQKDLAELLGFHSDNHNSIIQVFMQDYYQQTQKVILLNKIVLTAIQEKLLFNQEESTKIDYDNVFYRKQHLLGIYTEPFYENKTNVLKAFEVLSQHQNELTAFSADSLRLLRKSIACQEISTWANSSEIKKLFLGVFKEETLVLNQLQNMLFLGFLDKYVPHFATINGLMQFDLYHIHSVDKHTLMLIKNLQDIRQGEFDKDTLFYQNMYQEIDAPHLLYLAGFFHDIGKGSGRNHAQFGAEISEKFCLEHQISKKDTALVAWLVKEHLLISKTTKTKDIYEQETIINFCQEVKDIQHLNYLTLLTVADIKATNPRLWNDWNASLIHTLYMMTKKRLEISTEETIRILTGDDIQQTQQNIFSRGKYSSSEIETLTALWKNWPAKYFLAYSKTTIKWHVGHILKNPQPQEVQVFARFNPRIKQCEVTLYAPLFRYLFLQTTSKLDQMNLQIMDARHYTFNQEFALSNYVVTTDEQKIQDSEQIKQITAQLSEYFQQLDLKALPEVIQTRTRKQNIDHPTAIKIENPKGKNYTVVAIETADQHGLLAKISRIFYQLNLRIRYAKVNTLADQVEDYFYINNEDFSKVTDKAALQNIKDTLQKELS
ncbi:HD domain-containing protein, partial [Francisellaceae bacterium]|nr:HD domain-containing protein [Francisellaceae bacterium]